MTLLNKFAHCDSKQCVCNQLGRVVDCSKKLMVIDGMPRSHPLDAALRPQADAPEAASAANWLEHISTTVMIMIIILSIPDCSIVVSHLKARHRAAQRMCSDNGHAPPPRQRAQLCS